MCLNKKSHLKPCNCRSDLEFELSATCFVGSIGTGPGVINDMPGYMGGKQRMMMQQPGQGFNKFNNQQRQDAGMQRRQNGGSPTMGRHSPQNQQQQFQAPHSESTVVTKHIEMLSNVRKLKYMYMIGV